MVLLNHAWHGFLYTLSESQSLSCFKLQGCLFRIRVEAALPHSTQVHHFPSWSSCLHQAHISAIIASSLQGNVVSWKSIHLYQRPNEGSCSPRVSVCHASETHQLLPLTIVCSHFTTQYWQKILQGSNLNNNYSPSVLVCSCYFYLFTAVTTGHKIL